jgi:hypothetical protein
MQSLSLRSEPRERTHLEILMHLNEEFTPFEIRYIVRVWLCMFCAVNVFGLKREMEGERKAEGTEGERFCEFVRESVCGRMQSSFFTDPSIAKHFFIVSARARAHTHT